MQRTARSPFGQCKEMSLRRLSSCYGSMLLRRFLEFVKGRLNDVGIGIICALCCSVLVLVRFCWLLQHDEHI